VFVYVGFVAISAACVFGCSGSDEPDDFGFHGSGSAQATGGRAVAIGGSNANGGTSSNSGHGGSSSAGNSSSDGQHFSFFVTSLAKMQELSGSADGFGGDLRYGGAATGLDGADAICREIAESSLPGAGQKAWRAFLSTSSVDAIDRIGDGPWYDRFGRLVAANALALLNDRPQGGDAAIRNDLPNENGVPNHQDGAPGCSGSDINLSCPDNHDVLTGSGTDGRLYRPNRNSSTSTADVTCNDWTSAEPSGAPRCGHSWPREGSGVNWMSSISEAGCAPGINLQDTGSADRGVHTVGAGGGYGAIYCFALTP
jgi:hypothetical protein